MGAVYGVRGVAGEARELLWGEPLVVTPDHGNPGFERGSDPWVWCAWWLEDLPRYGCAIVGRIIRHLGVPVLLLLLIC